MIPINFIGLGFYHPLWMELTNDFTNTYAELIDKPKCIENGLPSYAEDDLHCTLMYNDSYQLGKNYSEVNLRYGNDTKYAFRNIIDAKELTIPYFKVDTFKNNDSIVLKINLDGCNIFNDMKIIHDHFNSMAINQGEFTQYHPHFTISYLNPETSDEAIFGIIEYLTDKYGDQMLSYELKTLMLSNRDQNEVEVVNLYD